jgi:hypothetical protein
MSVARRREGGAASRYNVRCVFCRSGIERIYEPSRSCRRTRRTRFSKASVHASVQCAAGTVAGPFTAGVATAVCDSATERCLIAGG